MANIGYIRVSSSQQNTARQHIDLSSAGITIDKVYEEKASGKNTERPQLKAMLQYVREGDTVYVESFSRLARSTRDLLNIIEELNSKGVQFVSLKENVDTSTPQGKFMLTVFAGLAELEREAFFSVSVKELTYACPKVVHTVAHQHKHPIHSP